MNTTIDIDQAMGVKLVAINFNKPLFTGLTISQILAAQDLGNNTVAHRLPVKFIENNALRLPICEALFNKPQPREAGSCTTPVLVAT